MKKHFTFFCPGCDARLLLEVTNSCKPLTCPRCEKEFTAPSESKAEKERYLRETAEAEGMKYARFLERRLEAIKLNEQKFSRSYDPADAIPPGLDKAAERAEKDKAKNPLREIELIDMQPWDEDKKAGS